MRWTRIVTGVALVLLVACTPDEMPTEPGSESPSPGQSAPASPSPSPTPSPWGADKLPHDLPVEGNLAQGDNAAKVVAALHEAAAGLPAVKLDVTLTQATLTSLTPDKNVVSFRWSDGVLDATSTDFQYLGQATFDPDDYPLKSLGRMFDVADLRGVHGDPIYQVQEYREGQVFQTVSSLPETATVFFLLDGSAVPDLGVSTTVDITDGLAAVTKDARNITQFGFSTERGFWADIPDKDGILTRTRVGAVPTFETRRSEAPGEGFDPELIDPKGISKALAQFREEPGQACSATIDKSLGRSMPVITAVCGGETFYADLEGRDMTALVN